MSKNGTYFLSIIHADSLSAAVWEPFFYRNTDSGHKLGDFVSVSRLRGRMNSRRSMMVETKSPFAPIEYAHVLKGLSLTYILDDMTQGDRQSWPVVGEMTLLFGTMRAYLGNVLVTPRAEWVGLSGSVHYSVKSEFVQVEPEDNLIFFWWAYLQSPAFLRTLPQGTGGTRPRMDPEALLLTPVHVPSIEVRQQIHEKLASLAEWEWRKYMAKRSVLREVGLL